MNTMRRKTFSRSKLSQILVDGLGRATKAHSAGEIQRTLAKLGVFFSHDVVKDLLDDLVEKNLVAYTLSRFFRNGEFRTGRAYHSLELAAEIESRGPKDPFESANRKISLAERATHEKANEEHEIRA